MQDPNSQDHLAKKDTEDFFCPRECPNRQQSTIANKGITYLVTLFLLLSLCLQVVIKTDEEGRVHWQFSTRDVSPETSLIYLGLIGSAIAIPMDKLALVFGRLITRDGRDK